MICSKDGTIGTMVMTDREVSAYMESLSAGAIQGQGEMSLGALKELLSRIGHPEEGLRYVHIAGTNGKGSVLAYISMALQEAGYRVGRFFSPALKDPREKIQVGQRPVTKAAVREGIGLIAEAAGRMQEEGRVLPTLFETETALAFWYFKKKACDIVVLECGLGGLQDATNVIPAPEVCVFTPVSLDHTAILGKTIAEIAGVKAGILKEGSDAVSAPQTAEAAAVLEQKAGEMGITLQYAEKPLHIRYGIKKQSFDAMGYRKMEIGLAGVYQPENAALALAVLEALKKRGFVLPESKLRRAFARTVWPGRFTVLQERPYLIMDGAHNGAAAAVLRRSLDVYFPGSSFVMILGVLRDKAYEEVLGCLVERAVQIVTLTPPENPRALAAIDLAYAVQRYGVQVTAADSVEEALELAELLSGGKLPILATGSLSWLGKLEDIVCSRKNYSKRNK
ncbi:MAG: bifunctional folylpolyglutamate synthase/dihydrofolate synthase [Lachnospiraceae bacterium]|nr:bifunctional folylpolyglutamate synthase/dihydrofolate synthase [Lachnospiraceae bacterium]